MHFYVNIFLHEFCHCCMLFLLVEVDVKESDDENECSHCHQSANTDASFVDSVNCWVIELVL